MTSICSTRQCILGAFAALAFVSIAGPVASEAPASDTTATSAPAPPAAPSPATPNAPAPDASTATPPTASADQAPAQGGSTPAAPQADSGAAPPLQLNYSDARPTDEKKTRPYLTLWRFSCVFGVQELGDEFVDRVGQLRHDLTVAYGDRLVGKAIVVDHYHLYLNQRAMQGENSWGTAMVGVFAIGIGADAHTTHPACSREKMPQGWFDPAELTTPWSPFIVEMEVHIDGQDHLVHSVYSPTKNMPAPGILSNFDVKAEAAAVHAAVDKGNAAMVAQVASQLGPPATTATQ